MKSQYDIALPVLEEHKIKSFFFVNTSIYTNEYNYTELFRLFRNNYFKDINEFYRKFFSLVNKNLDPETIGSGNPFKIRGHINKLKIPSTKENAYPWISRFKKDYPDDIKEVYLNFKKKYS